MARSHIRRNPEFDAWFTVHVGAQVKAVTEEVALDCIAHCPIGFGDLVESIHTRYPGKLRGIVIVGTDHWADVEYGTAPHWINSHGTWSLHNPETGQYFGRRVWHPGTHSQPFMRTALYKRRRLVKL